MQLSDGFNQTCRTGLLVVFALASAFAFCVCEYVCVYFSVVMPKRKVSEQKGRSKREKKDQKMRRATEDQRAEVKKKCNTHPDGSDTDEEEPQPGSSHKGEMLGAWTPAQMKSGWKMVKDPQEKRSKTQIADLVGVSKSTFMDRMRYLERKEAAGEVLIERDFILHSGGKLSPRSLSVEEEFVLKDHITSFGKRGFPLRPQEVRTMAHEMAEEKIKTREGDEMSYNWQKGFMARHQDLGKKVARAISISRATSPTREVVEAWFHQYAELIEQLQIEDPSQVWNIDEVGVNECPKTGVFIVDEKIKAQLVIPRERGQNITIVSYCNAAGDKSPPMIVMKGKNRQDVWAQHMPRGWHLRASESGYMNKRLFAEYGNIFIDYLHSKQMLEKKNLVIMDGHPLHVYNSHYLLTMKRNKVEVLMLPAHSTHFLQPLDQTPYSAFKAHWKRELRVFNRKKSGVAMSKPQFFLVFPRAWRQGLSPENIRCGYAMTGIWPLDPATINEDHYLVSDELCESCDHI